MPSFHPQTDRPQRGHSIVCGGVSEVRLCSFGQRVMPVQLTLTLTLILCGWAACCLGPVDGWVDAVSCVAGDRDDRLHCVVLFASCTHAYIWTAGKVCFCLDGIPSYHRITALYAPRVLPVKVRCIRMLWIDRILRPKHALIGGCAGVEACPLVFSSPVRSHRIIARMSPTLMDGQMGPFYTEWMDGRTHSSPLQQDVVVERRTRSRGRRKVRKQTGTSDSLTSVTVYSHHNR